MSRVAATRLISTFAVMGVAAIAPASAHACSCASTGSPRGDAREILKGSDGAFIGVLKSVRVTSPEPEPGEVVGPDQATFRYRVKRSFDAKLGAFVRLESTTDQAACGLSSRKGETVALGIYRSRSAWTSNGCSYMRPAALRAVADEQGARRAAGSRFCSSLAPARGTVGR